MGMTQKKNKSNGNVKLFLHAIRDIQSQQMKKKSIANTKKAIPFSQIISNRQENFNLIRCKLNKSDQICKGNSILEPPNDTTEQMDIVDQEAMGIHFQEDIIMDFLSRLPVQSLQRFKRVSKSWMTLISDPYFTMKHLNHAKNDENSQKLLTARRCFDKDDIFNFCCSSLSSVQVVEDEEKLDCPSNCKPVLCKILCCCDGLVLIEVSDRRDRQLLLWNPSTRESIVLPHPELSLQDSVCGLGYDTISGDYKILAINLYPSGYHEVSVELLALKSGFWRKLGKYSCVHHTPWGMALPKALRERTMYCAPSCPFYPTDILGDFPFLDRGMDYLAFVNEAFHWVGLSKCYTIVSFNISNEFYGEIPLLERMCRPSITSIERGVSVLRGMLCFYSTYDTWGEGIFKLWIMKDYGVKESWTELLTVQGTEPFCSAKPKYMFVDGEVLLSCNYLSTVGYVYRLSRGPFGSRPHWLTTKLGIAYTESLISPRLLI